MQKKAIFAILACVVFLSLLIPSEAWIYTDFMEIEEKYDDTRFETFGPRADRLLIKLYANAEAEWTAFDNCEVDLTDWPLTQGRYMQYSSPPGSNLAKVVSYGPDFDLSTLEINNNNNPTLGNPPGSSPNPVYPNPCSVLSFRQAIAHICNRAQIVPWAAIPLYTPVVPSQAKYMHPEIRPGGLLEPLTYPYDPIKAAALLTADGFPIWTDGWRYWDRNSNGIKDQGEDLALKFLIRIDCDGIAYEWGMYVAWELENLRIHVNRIYCTNMQAKTQVKENKDFHLYTEIRWIDKPHPNQFINWHWDFYWHPGIPPNYGGCNNSSYDNAADYFLYANNQAEAVYWSYRAQEYFAENVLSVPLFCYGGNMAVKRRYSGTPGIPDGEDKYEGEWWEGIVNIGEIGPDNYWSFLNMHTQCHPWGDCQSMTIRKGFKVPELKSLNPIYACSLWDHEVLDLIYEPLIRRNPYNYSVIMPWMVKRYEVGTYTHPVYGTCSKVAFTLRPDVYWNDGTPLTVADIYFTFKELPKIIRSRGLPLPTCLWKELRNIIDFKIFDPCNFEVLFDVKTYWALDWIEQIPILPKHIWKRIVLTGDPTTFQPDQSLIGCGPWRFVSYVPYESVVLVKNTGFFNYHPKHVNIHAYNYRQKFTPQLVSPPYTATINFTITDHLQYQEYIHMCNVSKVPLDTTGWDPTGSIWHLPWRDPVTNVTYKCEWLILGYFDQHTPPGLSPSDLIWMRGINPVTPPIWVHVAALWVDTQGGHSGHTGPHLEMNVDNIMCAEKYIYVDDVLYSGPIFEIEKPCNPIVEDFTIIIPTCTHRIKVAKLIVAPAPEFEFYLCPNNELVPSRWIYTWVNVTFIFWVTIPEDISGNTYYDIIGMPTYPYKTELPVPDCKVDIQDLARVSGAYGSYPGHPKWNPFVDVSCDYKIDIKDLAMVSKRFGWHG